MLRLIRRFSELAAGAGLRGPTERTLIAAGFTRGWRGLASGGGSGDDDDDDDDSFDELFTLEEETEDERRGRVHKQEEDAEVQMLEDKELQARLKKEADSKAKYTEMVSTSTGEDIVGRLQSATTGFTDMPDVGLPAQYARVTPHMLQVLRHSSFEIGKVFAYDAHKANHLESRQACIEYRLDDSELPLPAKHAATLIAPEWYDGQTNIIKIDSHRWATSDENRLFVWHAMESLIREARICVGDKVPEEDLADVSGTWTELMQRTVESIPREGLGELLQIEHDRVAAEHRRSDMLTKEYYLHKQVWYSKAGIREAIAAAREWRDRAEREQQRPLRRIPRDFVEKKSKFVPKDLRLV